MKRWYKPELKEIQVSELVKKVAVNANSGGGGSTGGGNTGKECGFWAGCDYSLFCGNVFLA